MRRLPPAHRYITWSISMVRSLLELREPRSSNLPGPALAKIVVNRSRRRPFTVSMRHSWNCNICRFGRLSPGAATLAAGAETRIALDAVIRLSITIARRRLTVRMKVSGSGGQNALRRSPEDSPIAVAVVRSVRRAARARVSDHGRRLRTLRAIRGGPCGRRQVRRLGAEAAGGHRGGRGGCRRAT